MAEDPLPAFDWTTSQKNSSSPTKLSQSLEHEQRRDRKKKKLLLNFWLKVKEPFAAVHTQNNAGNDDRHGIKHNHCKKHDSNCTDIKPHMCSFAVAVEVGLFLLSLP